MCACVLQSWLVTARATMCCYQHLPGTYYLVLKSGFTTSSARANVTVNIGKCPKGHVTGGRDDTCNRCPVGLFSFDPRDAQCSVCGANAVCPGGAVVWPDEGFWNSAPQSTQMHR